MTTFKTHYSCAELTEMKLPGLPGSERRMRDRAEKDGWQFIQVPGKGGRGGLRTEYQPPANIMTLIKERALQTLIQSTAVTPAATLIAAITAKPAVTPGELKDWQRQIAEARAAICSEVRRLETVSGIDRAICTVIDLAAREQLPPHIQRLVPIANAKAGKSRTLSRTTLYRWLKESSNVTLLAPKTRETADIPPWAPYLLNLYGQPQKPSLAYCVEKLPEILPAVILPPSYSAAHRFLLKMSNVDIQRGRMGSREIKSILPFTRRDTSDMWPTDAYTADGHTFDAEVAHPAHGKAFRPEITTVLDIATRKAVGWSVGLAESTWAVLDALRHACLSCGNPGIFYVDNGSGYKNAAMSDQSTGFMSRLGIELTHSLPYNSQARGVIERAHQTIWVKAAKTLPTYMGEKMDAQAKQTVFKITRKDIKTIGKSKYLMEWADFMAFCQQQIDDYNNRPHRALPKVRGEDGKKRHQTPNEAWAEAVAQGFEPVMVDAVEANDLFRPYKTCKIIRGEIRLFNNLYFSRDLEHHHGETARVGYDIHDASRVWVRNRQGQLLCIAEFEANKRGYFAESRLDQARYKRAQGRIKRAEAKIEEAEQELNPPQLIEYQPGIELPPMAIAQLEQAAIEVAETVEAVEIQTAETQTTNVSPIIKRPHFKSTIEKYTWLMNHKRTWDAQDARFLMKYVDGHQYFDMLQIYAFDGISWTKLDDETAKDLMQQEEELEEPEEVAAQ
jgi:putative transposase